MFDAIIFDKDQTLTDSSPGFKADPVVVANLRRLAASGVKLFIISAIRPEHSMPTEDWMALETARKIRELESAGIPASLFTEICVALPETKESAATFQEFSDAKLRVMQRLLESHKLDPNRVRSFGDDEEVEGAASQRLGIPFVQVEMFTLSGTNNLGRVLSNMIESTELPPTFSRPGFGNATAQTPMPQKPLIRLGRGR